MLRFEYNDGGRHTSRRPKQKNDCTVRALALATNSPYDLIYEFLEEKGRKCEKGFHLEVFLKDCAVNNKTVGGYKIINHFFPAVKGVPRMNVERFQLRYATGIFILRMSKHVACVKNGKLYDIGDCREGQKCVYNAFEFVL